MRKKAVTFEAVRALGREFQDLHESTMYGSPALKLGKRLVACLAVHRSAEPGSLVVRTDFEQRSALLGDDPETYYVTDHYAKHPVVLVRLARLQCPIDVLVTVKGRKHDDARLRMFFPYRRDRLHPCHLRQP